jgi:hypothetical protein
VQKEFIIAHKLFLLNQLSPLQVCSLTMFQNQTTCLLTSGLACPDNSGCNQNLVYLLCLIGPHICLYSQQFDHLIDMLCSQYFNINLSEHIQLDINSLKQPALKLSDLTDDQIGLVSSQGSPN